MTEHRRGPVHQHDCQRCRYLGHTRIDNHEVDVYHCPDSDGGSMVLRYGSEGPEYWSMLVGLLRQASDYGSTRATAALEALEETKR